MPKRNFSAIASRGFSARAYKRSRVSGGVMMNPNVYVPRLSGRYNRNLRGLNRRGVASPETGYVDLASSSYAMDTTGAVALIATIAQGASVNQRVGKKVMLKSLQIRGFAGNGTTASSNDCAMLIVYDKQPGASLPAVTDILDTANARSFNNDSNSGRFTILKRWDFVLNGVAATTLGYGPQKSCDAYLNLRGLPSVFKAAGTGAIGDIQEGALYLVTVGSTAAGTAAAALGAAFRTRFVDV
nr:MAG: putative capsid protein [Arizlama virus]